MEAPWYRIIFPRAEIAFSLAYLKCFSFIFFPLFAYGIWYSMEAFRAFNEVSRIGWNDAPPL